MVRLPAPPPTHPVLWPKDIFRSLLFIFPPHFLLVLVFCFETRLRRLHALMIPQLRPPPLTGGTSSFAHRFIMIFFFFLDFRFFPLMNGSVILTSATPPISLFAPLFGERGCRGAQADVFACCRVWFGGHPPRHTVGRRRRVGHPHFPGGAGNLARASCPGHEGVLGMTWPHILLLTHQPASPEETGFFRASLSPPAPA